MKKIAIIGGGIIGMTLANYLDTDKFDISLFDDEKNQATKASAGIISPWLSKRRNKKWYQLAKDGAAFFEKMKNDFELTEDVYEKCGTLFLRQKLDLIELEKLAIERKKEAPEMGEIKRLSEEETVALFPLLKPRESLYLSGGARLDGKAYLSSLKKRAQKRGVKFYSERATIARALDKWQVIHEGVTEGVDDLVLCPGPALKELLESIGTQVDVKPQKGQLISFQTDFETKNWPVLFLEGAADIIPFQNGQVLLGATHENEEGWDLSESQEAFESLTEGVKSYLSDTKLIDFPYHYRVGTRAYSSDFSPFFGPHPDFSSLAFASALGSSGLTTGPYIAYLLAQYFNHPEISWDSSNYQKDIKNYINIEKTSN